MPAKYKFTYFNCYGKGECSRLLFAIAGVEFEDIRLEDKEWAELKPKTPFGQIPLLEFDGRVFCQSTTIARYLANKFGFAGKDELDKLQAEMIVDCIVDIILLLADIFHEYDLPKRDEMIKKFQGTMKTHFANLEKLLDANKNDSGFFVGDSITWADTTWLSIVPWLTFLKFGPLVEPFPKLAALQGRVEENPRIAEYIRKRPKSDI